MTKKASETLGRVLQEAALLQKLVPDAVLVGGSVAALYAGHRESRDHDHVLTDLNLRFGIVLDALESDPEWVINRQTPGKIILGTHNQIEYGIRQLIRMRPLEVQRVTLLSGDVINVPTLEEALRIKAYLIVKRNSLRDFIDVAALSSMLTGEVAATVLERIDEYYQDPNQPKDAVATQLIQMLWQPEPADLELSFTKLNDTLKLTARWQDWPATKAFLAEIAADMDTSWL